MDIREAEQRPNLTIAETSAFLRIGLRQTYEAVRKGEIHSVKIGGRILVPTRTLLAMLEKA